MDHRIINLYGGYTHTPLSCSGFINRLVLLTGSITAAITREESHWVINSGKPIEKQYSIF